MNVALAALAGFEIEFEIGVGESGFADVIKRGVGERSASEIRVQDDAGRVDDWPQRIAQRLAKLALDRGGETGQREVKRFFVESVGGDLLAQTGEDGADRVGDGGVAVAGSERTQFRILENLVGGRQLLKEGGFGRRGHSGGLSHRRCVAKDATGCAPLEWGRAAFPHYPVPTLAIACACKRSDL